VNDQLAGQYQSVFKGRGMAFSEVRQYQPGDDVRLIDWNVSARMNEPFVKIFVEEREMTVILLVDMSASGLFGSRTQSKHEVAAVVALSAIKNNDRVGLIIFTDEVELFVPPKKGKKHVLRVISEILTFEPRSPRTDLAAAIDFMGRIARRRAVAFLVSDFLAEGWSQALRVAARKHDVVPVVIDDPLEAALPDVGFMAVEDLETGEVLEFDTGGPEAKEYAGLVQRRAAERGGLPKRMAGGNVNVHTDRPYGDGLVRGFRARARR